MSGVEDKTPEMKSISASDRTFDTGFETYNADSVTYNESGETYGGLYGGAGDAPKWES